MYIKKEVKLELIVLMISLLGVAIPISYIAKHMDRSPQSTQFDASSNYAKPPKSIKTEKIDYPPILIATEYSSPSWMRQSVQYGGLQAGTNGYQIKNINGQIQEEFGLEKNQMLSFEIPSMLIGVLLAPETEVTEEKAANGDRDSKKNISYLSNKIDLTVIFLTMVVWISGIFFNKFAISLAEKLKSAINNKN